jgi:hypothetical protein
MGIHSKFGPNGCAIKAFGHVFNDACSLYVRTYRNSTWKTTRIIHPT